MAQTHLQHKLRHRLLSEGLRETLPNGMSTAANAKKKKEGGGRLVASFVDALV